jgi:hypothetical protein
VAAEGVSLRAHREHEEHQDLDRLRAEYYFLFSALRAALLVKILSAKKISTS